MCRDSAAGGVDTRIEEPPTPTSLRSVDPPHTPWGGRAAQLNRECFDRFVRVGLIASEPRPVDAFAAAHSTEKRCNLAGTGTPLPVLVQ
jgi:hypothetical protein